MNESSVCRFCGGKLTFLQRLSKQEFCSSDHQAQFLRQEEQTALLRLMEAVQAAEPPPVPEAPHKQEPVPPEHGFLLTEGCTGSPRLQVESRLELAGPPAALPSLLRTRRAPGEYVPPEPGFIDEVEVKDVPTFLAEDASWNFALSSELTRFPAGIGSFELSLPDPVSESESGEQQPPEAAIVCTGSRILPQTGILPEPVVVDLKVISHCPPSMPAVDFGLRMPGTHPAGPVPPQEPNLTAAGIAALTFHCSGDTWMTESLGAAFPAFRQSPRCNEPLSAELATQIPLSLRSIAPSDFFVKDQFLSQVPPQTVSASLPKFTANRPGPRIPAPRQRPLFPSDPLESAAGPSPPRVIPSEAAPRPSDSSYPSSGLSVAAHCRMVLPQANLQFHNFSPPAAKLPLAVRPASSEFPVQAAPQCQFSDLTVRKLRRRSSGPPASRGILRAPLGLRAPANRPLLDLIPCNFGSPGEVWQPQISVGP